jgi:hypothetical protein
MPSVQMYSGLSKLKGSFKKTAMIGQIHDCSGKNLVPIISTNHTYIETADYGEFELHSPREDSSAGLRVRYHILFQRPPLRNRSS